MKFLFDRKAIFLIILISFAIKIVLSFYVSDQTLKNEWAILVHNFKISGILGLNVVESTFVATPRFGISGEQILPSAFMPPLYPYFLIFHEILSPNNVSLIITSQIILSLVSIYFFFKILINYTSLKSSLLLTFIFSIFPLYIYSTLKISSISTQVFLLILFFYFIFKYDLKQKIKNLILFSLTSGLLILMRGEFILFYFFTIFYFLIFKRVDLKSAFLAFVISLLVVSPYLKRNFSYFETITLTKSFGYNLLKGNNPEFKIEGNLYFIENNYNREELKILADKRYEINLDNFYKKEALRYIGDEPLKYAKFYLLKLVSFMFFDFSSSYPNYYNILHFLPKIILSILSLFGAILAFRRKDIFQYLSIFYFANIFLFSIFFILPRYSLILLPIQLILLIPLAKTLISKMRD
tara:strand:+ start:2852 stop:4081 length:1230 start_codon:yes stop_codon:yes gene_type:complete